MKLLVEDIIRTNRDIEYVDKLEDMVSGYRSRFPVYNKWMFDRFDNVGISHLEPSPEFKVYPQTGIVGDGEIVIYHDTVNIIARTLAFSIHKLKNEIKKI